LSVATNVTTIIVAEHIASASAALAAPYRTEKGEIITLIQESNAMSTGRIDVHQHVVPPFWAEALPAHGGDPSGWSSPAWTPENAVDFMDSQGIAIGILSLTAPGVTSWSGDERRDIARRVNEYTASLVAKRPDRFGNFVTLPLPDVEGALMELERAFRDLKADGVILLSNYEGRYLGDPAFEELWKELDRRKAVVFVHPGKPYTRLPRWFL
jgi:6-methylsalicylate decarboxylase